MGFRFSFALLSLGLVSLILLGIVSFFVEWSYFGDYPGSMYASRVDTALAFGPVVLAIVGLCSPLLALIERLTGRPYTGSVGLAACTAAAITITAFFAEPFRQRVYLKMETNFHYQMANPAISPGGNLLVFGSARQGGVEIVRQDLRTNATKELTRWQRPPRHDLFDYVAVLVWCGLDYDARPYNTEPSFSPDGSKILFISNRDGNREIYVMNADGTNQTRLTRTSAEERFPSYSPDGSQIVAERSDGIHSGSIWLMKSDASSPFYLTKGLGRSTTPSWSPGGTEIIFSRERPKSDEREIWVIKTDGSSAHPIRGLGTDASYPVFSPDSSEIVAVNHNELAGNTPDELWRIRTDGTGVKPLTRSGGSKAGPRFFPDGKSIVFAVDPSGHGGFIGRGGKWEIRMIDREARNETTVATAGPEK
jgi:Tol biopolymer transport system component